MVGSDKKATLRKEVLARRGQLSPEEHRRLSAGINARLVHDRRVLCAKTVLSYRPFGSEVDINAFNEWAVNRDMIVAYPACTGSGIMVAAVPEDEEALVPGRFGIIAPELSRSRVIAAEDLELVLVPCVGFDKDFVRLGMGGGFYDRYLPACKNAVKLGVAFSLQQIPSGLSDPWDAALDDVLCE
jgi:5-formyltetrahydrofolate cyclo-ligase